MVLAFLACTSPSHAYVHSPAYLSVGLGLLHVLNLGAGVTLYKNVSLDGYIGSSFYTETAAAYLSYNHYAGNAVYSLGVGPAESTACGEGCSQSNGMDARIRSRFLPDGSKVLGYYGELGYFLGNGNLFGSNPTHLPHFSVGLNFFLF